MSWIQRIREWWSTEQQQGGKSLPVYAWYADCFYRADQSFLKRD